MFEIGSLINSFGGLTWLIFFAVVAISIIVAVHEYGHYIVGRWCGIHADVFSVGFGKVLYSRTDKRGTVWQIAALPLGGYVKFKGDSNAASVDVEGLPVTMSAEDRRATMTGAPIWARAATAAAGPVFNFILSIALFIGLFMWQGQSRDTLVVEALQSLPIEHGIQAGDRIVAVAGVSVENWQQFGDAAADLEKKPLVDMDVLRDGNVVAVKAPFPSTTSVMSVTPNSAAFAAGVREGDVIRAIDGNPVFTLSQVQEVVAGSDGRALDVTLWNDGQDRQVSIAPRRVDLPTAEGGFETRWLMGVSSGSFFESGRDPLPFFQAAALAVDRTWATITGSLSGLYHIVTGKISSCNLSGPVTIAKTSGQMAQMGTISFLAFLAVLSTGIGLMNLFPIPVLDGGHLVFCAYEAVFRRPPSERAMQVLMALGMSLILSLMIFALITDFVCP